jgi:uncharacterized protein DUF1488
MSGARLMITEQSVGAWMLNENKTPVRVFVTYEALWQSEPSKPQDVAAAIDIFDAGQKHFEDLASKHYDANGPDEGTHDGQPFIVLRSMDVL